jgi:hypothetical protein
MTNFNAQVQQHQYQEQPKVAAPAMPKIGGKYEIRFGDPQETLQTHCTRCT